MSLSEAELAFRKDVYGYDDIRVGAAPGGRPINADAAMSKALAFGNDRRQALYHAGMIDAALGRTANAKTNLTRALDLDPSFDILQAVHARAVLERLP